MKRALLAAIAATLLIAVPASAAPPSDTATLSVVSIQMDCPQAPIANRGCITFQSDPDKANGGPNRHVVEVRIYGEWACGLSRTCLVESDTVEVDGDGFAVAYFRNGIHGASGLPYSTSFSAYVATSGDRLTPISPVVTGSLP